MTITDSRQFQSIEQRQSTDQLQERLRLVPSVSITNSRDLYASSESLSLLKIDSPLCDAVIAIQGAQLLAFTPKDAQPWLWLSPKAIFSENKPIRGGIPVCAPWFGVNQQDPTKPKHGFVRNRQWQLVHATENKQHEVELTFRVRTNEDDLPLYSHAFSLDLVITLSKQIDISFSVQNLSRTPMPFSWALHSYFCVDSLEAVAVEGLDQSTYLDATDQFSVIKQEGAVQFSSEVDRVYENVDSQQTITGNPCLSITGQDCPTAIIWNPGEKLAHTMADITANHYAEYICVERGAAFSNTWEVTPEKPLSATLSITARR